jgi:hypothetical protein
MSKPDLDRDVYVVCDCERTCRKDRHAISSALFGGGARCSVWISRRHLAVVAAGIVRRVVEEGARA